MAGFTGSPYSSRLLARTVTSSPPGNDLIGPNSGGKLVAASQDRWQTLTDGREQYTEWFRANEEAIYSFKDGRSAELIAFTFLVDGTRQFPVSMEFFAGDDGPAGAFPSIGVFKPAMTRLYETPYQSFPLSGVSAKFFKIKVGNGYAYGDDQQLSRQQDGSGMIQYRLIGTLK